MSLVQGLNLMSQPLCPFCSDTDDMQGPGSRLTRSTRPGGSKAIEQHDAASRELLAEGGGAGWPGIAAGMRRELGGRRAVPLLQLVHAAVVRGDHPVDGKADPLADEVAADATSQAAAAELANVNMLKLLVRRLPVLSALWEAL